jgi:probable 2-oxoglutarate dehydrogenase E1 component DHKTD1
MYLLRTGSGGLKQTNKIYRNYHSDNVFGFKRKSKSVHKVPEEVLKSRCNESNFYRLVTAYRQHAHKNADVNPVVLTREISILPELDPKRYGLNENDKVNFSGIINTQKEEGTVAEALEFLHKVYSKAIAVEFTHLENEEEIEWFSKRTEEVVPEEVDNATKLRLGTELLRSQNFDNFLANKFSGLKRYGGEGAESMMAFFSEFFQLGLYGI